MFAHGAQKMLGWFGGHGVQWTLGMWQRWFGLPATATMLVIIAEFVSPLLLLAGLLSRLASILVIGIMIGAVVLIHGRWGFFMNWYNVQGQGEGVEHHILMAAACLVILIKGSGRFSIDRLIVHS